MTTANPAYVQLQADGSGKKVRNLSLDVLQPDGSTATVYMQVVSIADENGNLLRSDDDWKQTMVELLHKNNELLELLIELSAR